jgi:hypothetical protein
MIQEAEDAECSGTQNETEEIKSGNVTKQNIKT